MRLGRAAGWLAAATGACLSACLLDRDGPPASPGIRYFPRDVEGLDEAAPPRTLDLADGDSLELTAAPVRKRIGGRMVRMLAFGGSVPGPLLRVPQGAVIRVKLRNRLGLPAGLHAHGVRVDRGPADAPAADGIVADGEEAEYVLRFPDPGLF
jgi:FtsP/CotA-like multicopper oxidase with cupredoxin domain